jgi:hypothetical protein
VLASPIQPSKPNASASTKIYIAVQISSLAVFIEGIANALIKKLALAVNVHWIRLIPVDFHLFHRIRISPK